LLHMYRRVGSGAPAPRARAVRKAYTAFRKGAASKADLEQLRAFVAAMK
jgi:hypothetical protein